MNLAIEYLNKLLDESMKRVDEHLSEAETWQNISKIIVDYTKKQLEAENE